MTITAKFISTTNKMNHPLLEYHIKQHEINEEIRNLYGKLYNLEKSTLQTLALYRIGQLVQVSGVNLYVKSVRLDKYTSSGISYSLVKPNKNGTMPKAGKYYHRNISQDDVTAITHN